MTKKLIIGLTASIILATTIANTDIGKVENNNFIQFNNGSGYYTDKQLNNIGENVTVVFDFMISDNTITYLK